MSTDPRIRDYLRTAEALSCGSFNVALEVQGEDDVARLGQSLLVLARTLETRFSELELLGLVTEKINSGLLVEDVLAYVYESFRKVIPYDRIGFSFLTDQGQTLTAFWSRSAAPVSCIAKGYSASMQGSSLEDVLHTGRPRVLNDLEAHLRQHPRSHSTRLIVEEGMRSSLTCPLIAMGKAIGFMFFSSMRREAYRDAHVRVFMQVAGQLAVIVEKSRVYQELLEERERSEQLLLNVLPATVAERLKRKEGVIADSFPEASVLFADLVGFTDWSAQTSPQQLVSLLNDVFTRFDRIARELQVEKIKTIGDAYMAAAGLPEPDPLHACKLAEMGLRMFEAIAELRDPKGAPLNLRIGIASGPVVAGVIGRMKFIYDLWGDTVNTASRMETHGMPGRIHVAEATAGLLREHFVLADRGSIPVKGKGEMHTFFVTGRSRPVE